MHIHNTLPKAYIYMEEIRQFQKLRRLRQLRGLRKQWLTNLKQRVFLFLNVKGYICGYEEGQPMNDSRLATKATRKYIHSRLAIRDTRE